MDVRHFELQDLLSEALIALEAGNRAGVETALRKALAWVEHDWLATPGELRFAWERDYCTHLGPLKEHLPEQRPVIVDPLTRDDEQGAWSTQAFEHERGKGSEHDAADTQNPALHGTSPKGRRKDRHEETAEGEPAQDEAGRANSPAVGVDGDRVVERHATG